MKIHTLLFHLFPLFFLSLFLYGCSSTATSDNLSIKKNTSFDVTNLTVEQYPDNPDIGFWAETYNDIYFKNGDISNIEGFVHKVRFYNVTGDSIIFDSLDLSELIPTIPTALKKQDYLAFISCLNQEWNRNQLRFSTEFFSTSDSAISRVDIARNCLQSYLWEIIVYTNEDEQEKAYAHGWFTFPDTLYHQLFEEKNKVPFSTFEDHMVEWKEPASEYIDLDLLRTVIDSVSIHYKDQSDNMYPLAGAREKKFKEIIYPQSFKNMRDLQTDSALFATFTPPGFYNKKDPRATELGRIYQVLDIKIHEAISQLNQDTIIEVHFTFQHKTKEEVTQLIIGGLSLEDIPNLALEEANKGWKNSMGISNHSFYEDYAAHLANKTTESAYYSLFLNSENNWLDSHRIGIDGPIIHFSDNERRTLEIWLLSFERHALVGHYTIHFS